MTEYELYEAIKEGNATMITHLLDSGAPMNFGLFSMAVQNKQYDGLQAFLDHGWDINTGSNLDRKIPSALVDTFDDPDLARWFLEHGADPNKRCQLRDATPLSYAVGEAPLMVIELLFEYGGSTESGQPPHPASMRKDSDSLTVLKYLCNKSPRVLDRINSLLDEERPEFAMNHRFGLCTPIQYAAQAGSLEAVKFLVEQGGDPWIYWILIGGLRWAMQFTITMSRWSTI